MMLKTLCTARRTAITLASLLIAGTAFTPVANAQEAGANHAGAGPSPAVLAGFPMNDEIRTKVRSMRGLALSPDGKWVLAGITDTTADGGKPHVWLLGQGVKPRQLTYSAKTDRGGESAAQFSPDGKWVMFIATRDGTKSLFRLSLAGGEAEPLALGKDAAGTATAAWGGKVGGDALLPSGYEFSPDGKYLAVWADAPDSAAVKARKERKDDGYNHEDHESRTALYLLDPTTVAARAVKLNGQFTHLDWSYDSADMIVTTDPRSDITGPDASFWQVSPKDLTAKKIDLPKTAAGVAFLPGRTRLVYTDSCVDDAPPRCNDLYVKDIRSGQARNLTRGFSGAIPDDYTVMPDGSLTMQVSTHMRTRLAKFSTKNGSMAWYDVGLPVTGGLASNPSHSAWAFIGQGPVDPGKVFLTHSWGAKATTLESPALVPATWQKVPSTLVTWTNEGQTIEGMLYMPPNVAPGTKVPLVMSIHGGPAGRFQDDYSSVIQMMVAQGWAVMQPNIRGSTGYGAKFLGANKNDLGGADFRDIMTGVDMLLKSYPIDESKMALVGYSYGGEMAGFTVGKTDRFKAIVSGAPVINQFSEYGTEHGTFYDRWYYGTPWDHFEDVWRQSPISYAKNAKTPFLLVQGQDDVTDPLGQSLEMYRALKQYGKPVALIVYPREGHPEAGGSFRALVAQEPWHGIDQRRRIFGFLRAAFAGEPDPLAIAREDIPKP